MTDGPHPPPLPSEDDVPEELSFVEKPAASRAPGRKRSQGSWGILISAVLGSVTAIGLFFVFKDYLDAPGPVPPEPSAEGTSLGSTAKEFQQPEPQKKLQPTPGANKPPTEIVKASPGLNGPETPESPENDPNPEVGIEQPDLPGGSIESTNSPQVVEPVTVVRHPKPAEDALIQARRDVDAVFSSQIRNARERVERLRLATVIKDGANAEPEGSATRFAMLEQAIDLAIDAPDSARTSEYISDLTAEYEVDPFPYRVHALESWDDEDIEGPQLNRILAQKAAILADEAYKRQEFKTAAALYAIASKRRDRADDNDYADLFAKKRTAARTQENKLNLARSKLTDLEDNPDDPEKNREAGLACMQAGLWDEGLHCLAKGSDQTLRTFAEEQLELRAKPNSALQAGDHSWKSLGTVGLNTVWLKELAVTEYESVFTELTPLQLQKIKLRIAEVGPVSCLLPEPILHFAFERAEIVKIKRDQVLLNRMGHYGNGKIYGPISHDSGIKGSAFKLDGFQNIIVCPQSEQLLPGDGAFTLSVWLNTSQRQNKIIAGRSFEYTLGKYSDFALQLQSNRFAAVLSPEQGDNIHLESHSLVPTAQWVHLGMTWDLQNLRLYFNGREDASLSLPYPRTLANRAWIAIGGYNLVHGEALKGKVDEVRFYDRALSNKQFFHVYLQDQMSER